MESHGRSTPIEEGRTSISRMIRVSRRCSTRCPSVGAGLDMVTKKSTLYLESARSVSLDRIDALWKDNREGA